MLNCVRQCKESKSKFLELNYSLQKKLKFVSTHPDLVRTYVLVLSTRTGT